METTIGSLVNLGIGGCMAAAVLAVLWHLVRVTIPEITRENRAALKEQAAAWKEAVGVLTEAIDSVAEKLEKVAENAARAAERLEAVDRHVKANQQSFDAVRLEIERLKALHEQRQYRTQQQQEHGK